MIKKLLIAAFFISTCSVYAQKEKEERLNVKFGKVAVDDFKIENKIDSAASALILFDIGSTEFMANSSGWFSTVFKRHKRIKILDKKGFDAANVQILLFHTGSAKERVTDLKGYTYNLENGVITETKLENKNVFEDKYNKNYDAKKFTFPAVKEGSIIDLTYTVQSDFITNLETWQFQGEYPCLWSEYQVSIPNFFNYVFLAQGYLPFDIKTIDYRQETFTVNTNANSSEASNYVPIPAQIYINRWVIKNVVPLKVESYISTLQNYVSKIEFQLSQYRFPNMPVQDRMGNWFKVSQMLMQEEDFGLSLTKNNNWLDDEMKIITAGAKTKLEKAQKIFAFVRDNFTRTGGGMYLNAPIKDVFKQRKGNDGSLNLLLIAMLKHEQLDAMPIMLSTKNNGYVHNIYPLMARYNYVVTYLNIDSTAYLLDPSTPKLGFGKLPMECYNGSARLIKLPAAELVELNADDLIENEVTSVFIQNGEKEEMLASVTNAMGYYQSMSLRKKIGDSKLDDFFKELAKGYTMEVQVENANIDSLKLYDHPIKVTYDLKFKNEEDIIYFNPILTGGWKNNPFKAEKRIYPVEMPYVINETYVLTMEIPKGYKVDELPKSTRVMFNENEGMFEYIIKANEETIQFKSKIALKKANFSPEDYESLRDFFGLVVKKHAEQIVFKKIK